MQAWRDRRRNKRERCEKQVCLKVICKDYERKKYSIHVGKEKVKEQYFLVNTDIWIRDLDL